MGGLELWLIDMRLEGTETHTYTNWQTHTHLWWSIWRSGHNHSDGHKGADKHTHFYTHRNTQQHWTPRKVPEVTRTQHLCAELRESLWDKRYLQQSDTHAHTQQKTSETSPSCRQSIRTPWTSLTQKHYQGEKLPHTTDGMITIMADEEVAL